MKQKIRSAVLTAIVAMAILALLAAAGAASSPAYAGETAQSATRIAVPLTVPSTAAVAGAEIEFSATGGLAYVGFEPAAGLENKVDAQVGGKRYVGCFSKDNRYAPVDGKIAFGKLVFEYKGDAPEEITFSEVRLHTVDAAGGVATAVSQPNTVVNITRRTGGGSAAGGGQPVGSGAGGAGDAAPRAVNLAASDIGGQAAIELDASEIADAETPLAEVGAGMDGAPAPGSAPAAKDIGAAGAEVPMAGSAGIPAWAAAVAVAVAAAAVAVFAARRRRRQRG